MTSPLGRWQAHCKYQHRGSSAWNQPMERLRPGNQETARPPVSNGHLSQPRAAIAVTSMFLNVPALSNMEKYCSPCSPPPPASKDMQDRGKVPGIRQCFQLGSLRPQLRCSRQKLLQASQKLRTIYLHGHGKTLQYASPTTLWLKIHCFRRQELQHH